jgi:uncharacterized protein (DUF1330 family)
MIFLTQIVYIKPGQEGPFNEFEAVALPAITRYHGQVLMRVRPGAEQVIEGTMPAPYEIHLISFPNDSDLAAFLNDEERKKYLHLKEASIESTIIYKGEVYP